MTSYDERITTYFGDAVLRAGFMPVPHLLMRHYRALDLLTEHAMFAMQLMEISWDLAQPPVTMRRIAERMGISVRTAQRYSEYLAARGLIVIYEQFEDGAQVENGYDLAPLFRALAAFAPEPRPGGTPRERRKRGALLPLASAAQQSAAAYPADIDVIPPGDSSVILPHDTSDTLGDDTPITPPRDPSDTPRPTRVSGLKGTQESPKKHQEQIGVGEPSSRTRTGVTPTSPAVSAPASRSLRLELALAPEDTARSQRLLDRLGVHAPVARACAPTLAPAEVLAVAAYARAAGLSTGWIASQIYDFERRAPRTAGLARRWDEAGSRLAALADGVALQLLDLVDGCAPDNPGALVHDPAFAGGAEPERLAAATLWSMMHEVRGGAPATRRLPRSTGIAETDEAAAVWRSVLERLRKQIAMPEYETWLQPARLLLLENDVAIVGTDNIFAREHLEHTHGEQLALAFAAERGRATHVDVVIG